MPVVLQPNLKSSELNLNQIAQIAAELKIVRPLAEVLYTRGFSQPEAARKFLFGETELRDPLLLSGLAEALETIRRAVGEGKRIVIYGDYDVDGVCAVTMQNVYDDETYLTRLYVYDGMLREWFSYEGAHFSPENGEAVCEVDEMQAELSPHLLSVRLRNGEDWTNVNVALRAAGE